jgi:hypothetical protein
MNYSSLLFIAIFAMAIFTAGCMGPRKNKNAESSRQGMQAESVDDYAKSHDISREEAVKRMREEYFMPKEFQTAEKSPESTRK